MMLGSNFPARPARGHTMGTPEGPPRDTVITLQLARERSHLSSTTGESRVGWFLTRKALGFPVATSTHKRSNGGSGRGPKGHSQTSHLQVRPAAQPGYHELTASVFVGAGLAETPCTPCRKWKSWCQGKSDTADTPHTHKLISLTCHTQDAGLEKHPLSHLSPAFGRRA